MISGWSSLQLPPGADSHGRGAFPPCHPSMASRPSSREQCYSLCRSYGDRGGLDSSLSFPELKATLVENLIGALINATDILDGYNQPPRVPAVVKQLLGFEVSSEDQDFALVGHSLQQSESLEVLFHERLSHGSSAHSSVSPALDNMVSLPLRSQRHLCADRAVLSSSASHAGGSSHGRRKLSVNMIQPTDEHGKVHTPSLEEDLLLHEARSKAFRSRIEPNNVKDASRAEILGDGLVDVAFHDSKQGQATNARYGLSKWKEVFAETAKVWSVAPEITRLSHQTGLFWGSIVLGMLLTATVIVTCRSVFFKGRQLQRPSVKRRILKSQWYGNPGSSLWEHKNFQMKISECPKYPLLEVDGDKKLLRFPSGSAGATAPFATKRESPPIISGQTPQKQPIRQSIQETRINHVSSANKPQRQPIRQTIHSSPILFKKERGFMKAQQDKILNGGISTEPLPDTVIGLQTTPEGERETGVAQSRGLGFQGTRVSNTAQTEKPRQNFPRINASIHRSSQGQWGKDDELDLDRRIKKLYQTIQAVEQHRRAAMIALEEERQRSLALEQEMSKQREAAALLGEEVRLLKESHNALVTSLRKKYSSTAAARTAADLVYQDWERHVAAE